MEMPQSVHDLPTDALAHKLNVLFYRHAFAVFAPSGGSLPLDEVVVRKQMLLWLQWIKSSLAVSGSSAVLMELTNFLRARIAIALSGGVRSPFPQLPSKCCTSGADVTHSFCWPACPAAWRQLATVANNAQLATRLKYAD